jgi:ABC-type multidrug transport system fused ATPase/permease subunit
LRCFGFKQVTELPTINKQVRRLWRHLRPRRKKQLGALVILMVLASFAEVVSIGAVLPFLGALTSPEKIFTTEVAQPFIGLLNIQSADDLLLAMTLIFMGAIFLAGLTRVTLLWAQTRLSRVIGVDFSVEAYERTLHQPYSAHISRNSSEILTGVLKASNLVGFIIQPVMLIMSSTIILGVVIFSLAVIQPLVTGVVFLGFVLIYVIVVAVTRRSIKKNSRNIAIQQGRVAKVIQEGLGGIRDVLIDGSQPILSKVYKDALLPMQSALASNQLLGATPRFGVETLGIVFISGAAYLLATTSGGAREVTESIPVFGALVLGAQRLLPVLQQIYTAFTTIKGNQASTEDALKLLEQPIHAHAHLEPVEPMPFRTAITIEDLGFRYTPQGPWVLRNLSLQIRSGSRVGFIGVTGSGKSTLFDIIMGLLTPTEGLLLIDDIAVKPQNTRAWQAQISHVPQSIYLSDTSVLENIAFGVPLEKIDLQRVKQAARQAQIAELIEGWAEGYKTLVGERGVRLSGGQRQRIGIARALYRRANVILFDESTSALDNATETAVMQAMETLGRDITILIIAHRVTTLKNCDQIVELSNGGIKSSGCYKHIILRAV